MLSALLSWHVRLSTERGFIRRRLQIFFPHDSTLKPDAVLPRKLMLRTMLLMLRHAAQQKSKGAARGQVPLLLLRPG